MQNACSSILCRHADHMHGYRMVNENFCRKRRVSMISSIPLEHYVVLGGVDFRLGLYIIFVL